VWKKTLLDNSAVKVLVDCQFIFDGFRGSISAIGTPLLYPPLPVKIGSTKH
jgi:hypothetical protein